MFGPTETVITTGVLFADLILIIAEASQVNRDPEHPRSIFYSFFYPELSAHYFIRLIITAVLLLCVYIISSIFLHRKTPITILRTDIDIDINSDFSKSENKRVQTIRANIPNVTAYFSSSRPASKHGSCQDVHMNAHCPGALDMVDDVEFRDQHTGGFEAIHSFGRPLRYRFYMLVFPKIMYSGKFNEVNSFFRDNLTARTQTHTYLNEHDCEFPVIEFSSSGYRQHKIGINVTFESGIPLSLRVRRIALHGVVDLSYSRTTKNSISIFVPTLVKAERIRISWQNQRLAITNQAPTDPANTPSTAEKQEHSEPPP